MTRKRAYGDAIAHSFGLTDAPSMASRSLRHGQVSISRLAITERQFGMSPRIPPEDTFIAAFYLTDVRHHELWSRGRPAIVQGYRAQSLRIVNLVEEYSANISCRHESVTFYLPRAALDEMSDEAGTRAVDSLLCPPGARDPIVSGMVDALLTAFDRAGQVSPLFVEHATLAVAAHLAHTYGGVDLSERRCRGGLSLSQARRAKAILEDFSQPDPSLSFIAQACGLSRSYFIKAFKTNTGLTPHQWRQRRRIERAKGLLSETKLNVAEVALACGFSDQSHLTRVFTRLVGDSPARWRKRGA